MIVLQVGVEEPFKVKIAPGTVGAYGVATLKLLPTQILFGGSAGSIADAFAHDMIPFTSLARKLSGPGGEADGQARE